jgi:prepilin-type N-terminal cleavage/methylation domain-containing protein
MNVGYKARNCRRGTTLVELVVAMALLGIVLGAIVPVFAGIRNGSDTQQACTEMLQNARVLNEHLLRHLAQARRIVGFSSPAETGGYIEFEAADGTIGRYGVNQAGYVEFGPPGAGAELAGPVSCLRFVCYDANDLSRPIETAGTIHFVTWEAVLKSPGRLAQDGAVKGACCLRAKGLLP